MENQIYILFFHDSEMFIAIQPDDDTLIREIGKNFPRQRLSQLTLDKGLIVETALAGQSIYYMIEPGGNMAMSISKEAIVKELFTHVGKIISPIKPKQGQGFYLPVKELSPEFMELFSMKKIDFTRN